MQQERRISSLKTIDEMTSTAQPVTIIKVSTNQIFANDTMHIFVCFVRA